MIRKIEKIKAYAIFSDFQWPISLPEFERFNLLYGWNGSGKTTLSKLFRVLEKKINLPSGEATVLVDGTRIHSSEFNGSAILPQVMVFNKDFVEENVFTETGDAALIFYIGKENVEKQKELGALRELYIKKEKEFKEQDAIEKKCEVKLEQLETKTAKEIKETLLSSAHANYNNYSKKQYKSKASSLFGLDDWDKYLLTDEQKCVCRQQKDAKLMDSLPSLSMDISSIIEMHTKVKDLLQVTVVSNVISTFVSNHELAEWAKEGLSFHKKVHSKDCLFCGGPLDAHRMKKLESHFNAEYEMFISSLDSLIKLLDDYKSRIANFQMYGSDNLYAHLRVKYAQECDNVRACLPEISKYLDELISALQGKRSSPFIEVSLECKEVKWDANFLQKVNVIIEDHNRETEGFDKLVRSAYLKLEEDMIARTMPDYKKQHDTVIDISSKIESLRKELRDIDLKKTAIAREIESHQLPLDSLNRDLKAYLGREDLYFVAKDGGYQLFRAGYPADNLCEGEKSAIAFLYFLTALDDRKFEKSRGIVVIDDPVSSLDSNSLFAAFGFMKERVKDVHQLFILTHNFLFLRQTKRWFKHLKKCTQCYMVSSGVVGDSRVSTINPLDSSLDRYESEYHYLFKLVYTCAHNGILSSENAYCVPNAARRLLEAFLSFKHPNTAGDVYKQIGRTPIDVSKQSRIERFVQTYSHHGFVEDMGLDLASFAETQEVLKNILELIQAEDSNHYAEMEESVNAVKF